MSLMNQKEFRLLFDNHFHDFSEIKSILLIENISLFRKLMCETTRNVTKERLHVSWH